MNWALGDKPLQVIIEDGVLKISIGVLELVQAVQYGLDEQNGSAVITNAEYFAQDILSELLKEDDDGTTLVHKMLDSAASEAIEWGSEWVEFDE